MFNLNMINLIRLLSINLLLIDFVPSKTILPLNKTRMYQNANTILIILQFETIQQKITISILDFE